MGMDRVGPTLNGKNWKWRIQPNLPTLHYCTLCFILKSMVPSQCSNTLFIIPEWHVNGIFEIGVHWNSRANSPRTFLLNDRLCWRASSTRKFFLNGLIDWAGRRWPCPRARVREETCCWVEVEWTEWRRIVSTSYRSRLDKELPNIEVPSQTERGGVSLPKLMRVLERDQEVRGGRVNTGAGWTGGQLDCR